MSIFLFWKKYLEYKNCTKTLESSSIEVNEYVLPCGKNSDWSTIKEVTDNDPDVFQMRVLVLDWLENIVAKVEKCLIPGLAPFPTIFSKSALSWGL